MTLNPLTVKVDAREGFLFRCRSCNNELKWGQIVCDACNTKVFIGLLFSSKRAHVKLDISKLQNQTQDEIEDTLDFKPSRWTKNEPEYQNVYKFLLDGLSPSQHSDMIKVLACFHEDAAAEIIHFILQEKADENTMKIGIRSLTKVGTKKAIDILMGLSSEKMENLLEEDKTLSDKDRFLLHDIIAKKQSQNENHLQFRCEACNSTELNTKTGRCTYCKMPSEYIGYCIDCDKFWPLKPGEQCPEHMVELHKFKSAMVLLRLSNKVIDEIIIIFIFLVLCLFPIHESIWHFVFITFSYYLIFEALWQRTPAKFITGTKVILANGEQPKWKIIAMRTLIRFIPFDWLSFLGEDVYGWHDRWTKTYVVKAKRVEKKNIAPQNHR